MAVNKPPLWCLAGPTASGKTDLAIALAERCGCELVSVDSVLVYRGLDIGSAKPDYPHYLMDILDPSQPYSAAEFARDAKRLCEEITARGNVPLLVGGTMLYFKAFLEGLAPMPAADEAVRAAIELAAQREGWAAVHRELAQVDPEAAARIHPHHSQRISRALEVYRVSGVTQSEWQARQATEGWRALDHYQVTQLALWPADRAILHARIALRLDAMFEQGFEQEVRTLYERGDLHTALPAVRAVGYRQMWSHWEGVYDIATARQKALAATRQLAKRQLTWLRKWPDLQIIYTDAKNRGYADEAAAMAENPAFSHNIVNLALKNLKASSI